MTETKHEATLIFDTMSPLFIKLAKRLNQLANLTPPGLSIMTVTILFVDQEPILWLRPEIGSLTTSEPKGRADEFLDRIKNLRK